MGAKLENLIRMIPWGDFWEPVTTRQKYIKWTVFALVLSLGISIFILNLDNIQAYEYACENPVIVDAERYLVADPDWLTGAPRYKIYASYSYRGVEYENVFYKLSKNPAIQWDGVETLTIAVDPNNPGMPIRNMFDERPVLVSLLLWTLGLSMLIYGTALEFPSFCEWSVLRANRPTPFTRPYGKRPTERFCPDYLKDLFFVWLPILSISLFILMCIFPNAF